MNPCPKCGRKETGNGETFCGKCEAEYRQQEHDEIASLQRETQSCRCQNNDEPCQTCYRRFARILSLQGREGEAEAMLNR